MKTEAGNRMARAVLTAVASILMVGLAACEQKPQGGKAASESAGTLDGKGGEAGQDAGKAANPSPAPAAVAPKAVEPLGASENAALAAKVKAALAAEPGLKALAIDVNASGGAVTLFGTVDTRANRGKAAKLASGVEGVKSVQNNLVLVSGS